MNPIPADLVEDVARLADKLGVPTDAVLRACHAKVQAVLTGESLAESTWRDLIETDGSDYPETLEDYHLTALRLAVADPDAEHDRQTLLSTEELRGQLGELAGRPRELPDRRAHQLIEDQARRTPDAIAAVFGPHRLTYRELDERANRVAHALLADGLRREDVVAVRTERNLDWLTAVLAIFKAGGAYLPIEPHFPQARIDTMLRRAQCEVVLTEATIAELADDRWPSTAPDVTVDADQLAYIYFTSGSTGEPKGAMCEQAGMLNHLLAKIEDLDIEAGTLVAQTAPQCFDISLWQLVSALLVGGTTVLVAQETLLDVGAFAEELAGSGIEVLQVVPSYLDLLLTELDQRHRALPALRCVSVTGEALRFELVRRWFASFPQVPLVNAYGLTETSDDTNHEVMRGEPADGRILVGRPVRGARVYVVDANLMPVPLGAPGEIVFAGVCVGRGYVNDPERTAAAFGTDPHRPGERLYRSGDFGRWTPDGRLEYLGRRDSQVKIHGLRIEIGEIENQLVRLPGVREAAVIPVGNHADAILTACYAGPPSIDVDTFRAALGRTLPEYMVPSSFIWLDTLPLTGNGKINRKALARIAASLTAAEPTSEPPITRVEQRMALAWSEVLAVPVETIGRSEDFFQRGGSSLSALRLVIALDRQITLANLTGKPVLADLAQLLVHGDSAPEQLLHRLSPSEEPAREILVGFPYAGGNAMNYRPLADALRGSGVAVYGVEPSGDFDTMVERVVAEITALDQQPVLLWGHSAGAACALATARRLDTVQRVFIGAQLPGTIEQRKAVIAETRAIDDASLLAELAEEAGVDELRDLSGDDTRRYRHDSITASEFFIALHEHGSSYVDVPVTVVLAKDDPSLLDGDWSAFADDVEVRELTEGGHYFLATRSAEVADIVSDRGDRT